MKIIFFIISILLFIIFEKNRKKIKNDLNSKITIIMSYYNRKKQLLYTLESFKKYNNYNLEVIIVDDLSNEENNLEDIIKEYNFKIKLIKVMNKYWVNPCVGYNIAINNIDSDTNIVIIQNPEIFHCGNIINYLINNLKDNEYFTFPVFSSPNFEYNDLIYEKSKNTTNLYDFFLNTEKSYNRKFNGWYNHHVFCPHNYHFLSALFYKDLKNKIGGFNNEFKDGIAYDDDEFVDRIEKTLKIKCLNTKTAIGIHLFHDCYYNNNINRKDLILKNRNLLNSYRKNNYNVYCSPKIETEIKIYTNY